MRILFSCAGSRNYLLKYFKDELGASGQVYAADVSSLAPALQVADRSFLVSPCSAADYIPGLLELCEVEGIDAVISLNDIDLPVLSQSVEAFRKIGTRLIVSSPQVIDITYDKWKTANFFIDNDINTPLTYLTIESALSALDSGELCFPVVIKPRWGSCSVAIAEADSISELSTLYAAAEFIYRRSGLSSTLGHAYEPDKAILVQQKLPGIEYGLDIVNDLNGNYRATIVKEKHSMKGGETAIATTREHDQLSLMGLKIGTSLGHIAMLDADIFDVDGTLYALELNPRFGGGYPFSHEAGANIPAAIITWLKGQEPPNDVFEADPGKTFGKYIELAPIAAIVD